MEKCREYSCTDSGNAQKKISYGWNEDCKNSSNNGDKESLSVVNLSGGKDSTAALILMVERELPIDVVFMADTGKEFPEIYEHLEKVDEYLYRERGYISLLCVTQKDLTG